MTEWFTDLEAKASKGDVFTPADAERVLRARDLISVGVLGEAARQRRAGQQVTFARVLCVADGGSSVSVDGASEVRLVGRPTSVGSAVARIAGVAAVAAGLPVSGFSAADLLELCGHDHLTLAEAAARLRAAGLEGVSECPLDRIGDVDTAAEVIRALRQGGLAVRRLTVDRAAADARLDLAFTAQELQSQVGGICAFAPLPRLDPIETPSTGYDDVRTVALAALICRDVPAIQTDWPLYGPKLAQVAIAYGANDIDGIEPGEPADQGPRRSPREEILRQIRAAGCVPVERNGRYERLP